MYPIPNGFWDRGISLYSSKIVDEKDYVLFLVKVFIVQVIKLVQITKCNTFSKMLPLTLMHMQLVWGHGVLLVYTVK
jgi:hypothetical protein